MIFSFLGVQVSVSRSKSDQASQHAPQDSSGASSFYPMSVVEQDRELRRERRMASKIAQMKALNPEGPETA